MVQQYCEHCRLIKDIQDPRQVKLRSGSKEDFEDPEYVGPVTGVAIIGTCPTCRTNLCHKISDTAE